MTHITSQHIYNRIGRAYDEEYGLPVTFHEVQIACEKARENGIVVQTYGDPREMAKMLYRMGYLR